MLNWFVCIVVPQMEQILSEIRLHYTDRTINEQLQNVHADGETSYTRHFDQGEDFFVRLSQPFRVPQLPIHHDIHEPRPKEIYIARLRSFISELTGIEPSILADLAYLFDPTDILRPGFFRIYRDAEQSYLYLVHIDLTFRPQIHRIITRGDNDTTPEYETNQLFVEADLVPIETAPDEPGAETAFRVQQSVSQTWIGETGRGYFVQGIWIDRELTKFFTKLFLPKGKRVYPYYPFTCKYRAICYSVIDLAPSGRQAWLPVLRRASDYLKPHMDEIQDALKAQEFTETIQCFQDLKKQVPPEWEAEYSDLRVRAYLNDSDQKEYALDHETI